jgi:hypothetical protein
MTVLKDFFAGENSHPQGGLIAWVVVVLRQNIVGLLQEESPCVH